MNRVFRIIWSKSLRAWVVTSELSSGRGKGGRTVDERAMTVAEGTLDRKAIEGSPPTMMGPLRASILMVLLTACAPAWAADRWWDPNHTAVGIGGAGTWGTSGAFWSPNSDGVSGPFSAWNNGALDDAFFAGTAGTVTLSGAIAVHNINFQTSGYTLTGGSLTPGGATPTLAVATGTATIDSSITSASGWIKAGGGTLTLNGSNSFGGGIDINGGGLVLNAANSFTGNINATGGNLSIGAIGNAALGNVSNQIYLAGGKSFSSVGAISNRTVNLTGGIASIGGAVGSLFYTGAGGLNVASGVALTNDANNYTGQTQFTQTNGNFSFSSIADLGVASALGAPTTAANGTVVFGPGCCQTFGHYLSYTGTGNSSNRNWLFQPGNYAGPAYLYNSGSGTLRLTGDISATAGTNNGIGFIANTADLELLGVISSNNNRTISFSATSGNAVRLGIANTFTGAAAIGGAGTVEASVIANVGVAGSLGVSSVSINGGNLSYVGAGESSNKPWGISNGSLNSNGTGALSLSGTVGIGGTATLGGNFTGADNVISGVVSGAGSLRSAGNATWTLTGANTYTGSTIVDSGVLRAGTANAFGASTAAQVNGGTLDLNDFDKTFTTLAGTGGTVDLGTATLTLQAAAGTTASYAGNITGSGGLTKLGASTQTLTGANTYTGNTTIGGGVLALDFSPAGGPAGNIVSSSSTLDMAGGRLNVIGAAGESNTQTFNGLNISAGNNTLDAKSGAGGSLTVNLGAITRTGGLMNFNLPVSGNITTTNITLGGWATVNGTDYAKVVGGNILAFTPLDYTNKDNAANWLDNEYITDSTGFFNTVSGTKQLAGLRYTVANSTTVTVDPGQTLGVDGTIIVAPSVLNTNQVITGGTMTGANGGDLGIQQNSTGNFTIASQIIDNGAGMGFVKAGTGLVTLSNPNNSYTGGTRVAQGTLSVGSVKNGGVASSIGASSAASSNLVLEGATLRYTGAGDTSDRGFTFGKSGAIVESGVEVTNAGANLSFGGLVTSPDGANFTKSGAGTLTLANAANDFTGIVTVNGGLLSATTLADGGQASSIGAGGSASANLVLNGGGLQYTGGTITTNRGFTLGNSGGIIDVTAAATTLTDSGIVTGGGRLTKNGAGTLVLTAANTYTGGNTVNNGVLRAGAANVFGALTAATTNLADTAGVMLDLNNFNNVIGPLNGGGANGGNVTLGSGTLRIAAGNGNYSGVISGTGGVWRTDGGTQTFNGCNHTYTGVTNLQGAVLSVNCLANGGAASGIGASSSASSNLVFTNGNLNYTGGTVSIDRGFSLTGYGVIDVVNGTTLGFSGQVVGGGELYKDNAGTLVLSGNNTYTSNTRVRGGILRAGSATAFGTTNSFWLDNTAGVLLDLNNFNANAGALIGGGSLGGNIALGTGTLTIRDGLNQTYVGAITGTGNLVKNGGGNQRLAGCNSTYTGGTTINAGILSVDCLADGGLNSSIGASTSDPANLVINGMLNYVGDGDSTDRRFTIGTSGATLSASGTGIVEFTNTNPVTLSGANTARTLTLTGTNTGYNLLAAQLDNNGAGITSLTKAGTGTWRLTNANSAYTGVTRINGGVLSVDQLANGGLASSIGASSNAAGNLVIGNGSTLRYTGAGDATDRRFTLDTGVTFIESSGTGALQFTNTGAVALTGTNATRTIALGGTNTGANTMGGAIGDNGTGRTTLAKNDSGTWILTGNNTYTGNTVINNGNLMIGNGGTTGNAGAGNVIVDSPTSTLSLNRSDTFTFSGTLSGPGTLAQIGSGTSVLTSANNQIGATTIGGGTLQVDGGLTTPTLGMTGASALTVNGAVQATGGTQAALTGDAGNQSIVVNGTLLANGDLGDGSDTVNLTGTLNTGVGALNLGAGDDTLTLNDGAAIAGVGVDAGTGSADNLVINNAADLTFSGAGVAGFEQLTKQNTGVLTMTGSQAFSAGTAIQGGTLDVDGALDTPTVAMSDGTTLNVDGTVQAAGGTATAIIGSAGVNTLLVNAGATLIGNGDLGAGSDVVTLGGTLNTGATALNLGDGDDTLTLTDGAALGGVGVAGGVGGNDRLVLDTASGLVFDGGTTAGFELLSKQGAGTATMTGSQSFSGGTTIDGGTLSVVGALETPTVAMADGTTLSVQGSMQAAGATTATITGSTGANTVSVGAGGNLLASGDLGDGNDILDVAGRLDTGAGVFDLGAGDDTLTIHDGTNIVGTVVAGAGNDTFNTNIATVADLGAVQGFETLSKSGAGVLNLNGPLSSDFTTVDVQAGVLNVSASGSVTAAPGNVLTTTVGAGATLNVDGSYGCGAGNDSMSVSGTVSGSGTIDLCGGDDTLTLNDGAVLSAAVSGGTGTGDTLVLNNAGALSLDAGSTSNFEVLQKDNAGVATLTGASSFAAGTAILGGTLDVDGSLETPAVTLADGTVLNIDGSLQAAGATAATITGSTGANTVSVGAGGNLLASGDLGDGNDLLDVAGRLDTGAGVFDLGAGDDTLTIHDGTNIVGTVVAGAGNDTFNTNIATVADLGAVQGFETLSKSGAGVLNLNGPLSSDFTTVDVQAGVLNVSASGSVTPAPGGSLTTHVASGATLNVDGSYNGGSTADTFTVSGTVSGSGGIDLGDGDDTLTLNDGAVLANAISGGVGAGDAVVLNNAGAFTFDAANTSDFEVLQKNNAGEATLTGTQSFAGGTALNGGTLTVAGSLDTPTVTMADATTLNVGGSMQGGAGTAAAITGSAGSNTVNVAAGASLLANGDLGDGSDILDVAGSLDTGTGVLDLGAGDDTLSIHDGTILLGTVAAGAGTDLLNANIATSADLGAVQGFEALSKTGTGALNINGPAGSDFVTVDVLAGSLNIAGAGSVVAQNTTIASGAALNLVGSYAGTAGNDSFTVAGTVAGTGTLSLLDGDDTFTIRDGADLSALSSAVDGGTGNDTFVADLTGTATLGGAVNFETLTKTNTGTLNIDGPAASAFTTVNVDGGTLDIGAGGSVSGVNTATVANGASLMVDGTFGFTLGADSFTVAGNVSGSSVIDMLDGDDHLILHDGADMSGLATPIDGGAGIDTLTADYAGTATLGGATRFETLTKTNTGTLNIDGPAASDFTTVNVDGGTLDIGAAGSVSGVVTTTVAHGATLNVDGNFAGSAGGDTMTVSGAIAGSGAIAFDNGDDTLTLNDGADLSGFSGLLDGGAGGDTVVLNNAGALSFGAGSVANFEFLTKNNTGTATLTGVQNFSGGTAINGGELAVAGALSTPTVTMGDGTGFTVDGSLDAGAGTAAAITGSAGANTVTINGTALASGDLGAGEDVLDVVGTLDTVGGVFALGDGDDSFVVHDGTTVLGTIDGGAGLDTRVYDINLSANLGSLASFEGVTKTGTGVLNVAGPGATDLQEVSVLGGTLNLGPAGSVVATAGRSLATVVAAGATLNVDGSYGCGAANDTMAVSGTVSGSGTIDLCGGEDVLTLSDGAVLNAVVSGGGHGTGDTVALDTINAFSLDAGNTINFEFLQKNGTGEATLTGAQSFSGGTTLNGGTLSVAGTLQTPTLAMADGTTLAIDGTVQGLAAGQTVLTGSAGTNTVEVAAGARLLASGDLGDGDDAFDLAGTLDTGSGTLALGSGDDRFIVHETTVATGTVEGGLGNDTLEANIGGGFNVPLGSMLGFESLAKSGAGALQINGPSDFINVEVTGGLLDVAASGSVAAQHTTVAAGSTLKATGLYTGTAGNDTFGSAGTVIGSFEFGTGNDTADFRGGDLSGLVRFDGGAGGEDRVNFHSMTLDQSDVSPLSNWERVDLLAGTQLTLTAALNLAGGLLSIDGSSELIGMSGASLTGNVANSGFIRVGGTRFGISGNYTGGGGLALTVSPGSQASGGLDIGGDVIGITAVTFLGDGSETPQQPASIRVISAPNDNAATAGSFTAASASDGVVRLNGSVFPWTFDRQGDGWYLNTEASDILPEIGGYAVLPSIGAALIQENNRLLFERMAGVRGDTPRCGSHEDEMERASWSLEGDCHGFWMAATGSELEMGANPGFAFSGDTLGLYVGADALLQERETRNLRGGLFIAFQHGNYWASGANSTDLQGIGEANVRVDTPMVGMYGSVSWKSGTYLDMTLVGQLPEATIAVADGFKEEIGGNSLTASAQIGHRFHLGNGWTVEPQVNLSASAMQWEDKLDASGKQLVMDDDLLGTARVAVRADKLFETSGGARVRPWATLGVQDTVGEKDNALVVLPPGATAQAQAFPNHELGLMATVDVGVEAELNESVSLFGVLSYGESLDGSDAKQRQANLGIRIRW
ncbi:MULTISPECIES: autotransporter-associated beta strand repeat-containing protein [unclassified Lysobacter]|uniref:autotransporter-associated beta strand repeat-containing protein n=1 Tax=unclassified Lysobacter TaxID=2635362 RepID=UPI001BE99650|nr:MULTISPECIES: autotransporter-associated beta strand repeat-containing protein [unclassified Lysobacter]MBT2748707.1 autotransporter-associated beta strand repeat-containing protein [Lysobacter sp. ISL-42]MBT2751642.1 autotransporter-associated beta strand repeat-containing protein [Lysobacter sp. ISL-50]MBT2775836.1 autotransporter-associated beta strand repeat-containing protein [Lysobacter sp. ISL-54]MBT2782199.1 autotransporter-associated beta strand repeat-containing protein [Lysobacter